MTARASWPARKDFHTSLRSLVVPCALKQPPHGIEPSDAWRKSPVCPKEPRKALFEPRASERELDVEGNCQLLGVFMGLICTVSHC